MIGKVTVTDKCTDLSRKFTEGEWKTVPHLNCGEPTGYLCIQFGDDEMSTTEALRPADATLMAASKELHAACQAFVDLFRTSDMRPEDECHEVFSKAYDALVKAGSE